MRTNVRERAPMVKNFEGSMVREPDAMTELRRILYTALLFENTFYENGVDVAARIKELVAKIKDTKELRNMAVAARTTMNLRHVPLLLVREMARNKQHRWLVQDTLYEVIQRADEIAEFLALYWKDGKQPLASSVKKGLARAFEKFSEYDLAKYNRDNPIKLRDVMFMVHPSATRGAEKVTRGQFKRGEMAAPIVRPNYKRTNAYRGNDVLARLASDSLETPDTWEVALSAKDGIPAKDKWTRLLKEKKMGALAVLRNLRNFEKEGVSQSVVNNAIMEMNTARVLPFRFVAANRASDKKYANLLTHKMAEAISGSGIRLKGRTIILIDVSGSMEASLSSKSDMSRMDAAAALGVIGVELCEEAKVFTFSNDLVHVPNVHGLSGVDTIIRSQWNGSTQLAAAVSKIQASEMYDRLIVITDEQAQDARYMPNAEAHSNSYIINVAPYRYSVSYGSWVGISGFSESIFRFIQAYESREFGAI